jgi:hypothetical protein
MKKTLIFALVLGLAVMFAVPAFAFKIESAKDNTFYFGAAIFTDLAAWNYSKELGNGKSDKTQMILDLPQHSRVRGVLEVGNVGAYWEIRMGSNQAAAQGVSGNFSATGGYYFAESAKLYGYYKFGNCTLLAGKTDGHFYSVAPYQNIGYANAAPTGGSPHIALFGWGNNYDNRNTQVRFSQDVSKTFGYDISLVQPQYYFDNGTGTATGGPGTVGAVQSYATFPMLAAKLRMNFGPVSLMPAGYVQYVKWDNLAPAANGATPDDNMTSWGLTLPVVVKAGAFTGTFAGTYGINMGTRLNVLQGALQAESVYQGYGRTPGGAIKNTTGWNAFMDLAFTSGPVTPHFYMGYDKAVNDDIYGKFLSSGSDNFNQRYAVGASLNWKIAESFFVVPEFTYYNYGKNPLVNGNPDLGTEWMGGVQFQFIF